MSNKTGRRFALGFEYRVTLQPIGLVEMVVKERLMGNDQIRAYFCGMFNELDGRQKADDDAREFPSRVANFDGIHGLCKGRAGHGRNDVVYRSPDGHRNFLTDQLLVNRFQLFVGIKFNDNFSAALRTIQFHFGAERAAQVFFERVRVG